MPTDPPRDPAGDRFRLTAALGVALAAFGAYLAALPAGLQWLDAPEFLAAAAGLGLPHPPGHPAMVMPLKALQGIPAGDLAFRSNLFSALFGAVSAGLTAWLAHGAARSAGARPAAASLAAAASGLGFALSGSAVLQALSVEVYTLSCALVLGAVAVALHRPGDARSGAAAAVLLALGLANHHLLAVLAAPAVLAAWWRRGTPWRAVVPALVAGLAVTVACYLYLPVRGARDADPSWADTTSLDGVLWYASARVFAGSLGGFEAAHATPAGNLAAALGLLAGALSPVVPVLSVAGAWVLLRSGTRRPVLVLALLVAGNLPSKVAMGILDPSNPDDHGYFLPALAGLAVLAGVAGPVLASLASSLPGAARRAAVSLSAVLSLAVAALPLAASGADAALRRAQAAGDLAAVSRAVWESLPPRSVALPSHYPVHFALMAGQKAEGARPDVTEAQQSLYSRARDGRWYAAQRARRDPDLGPLVDGFLRFGSLDWGRVLALSAFRPVRLQASDDLGVPLEDLRFDGWTFAARPPGLDAAPPMAASGHADAVRDLPVGWPRPEIETRRVLLRHLATAGGWLAGQGRRDDAARLLDAALELAPRDTMLRQMRGALSVP